MQHNINGYANLMFEQMLKLLHAYIYKSVK